MKKLRMDMSVCNVPGCRVCGGGLARRRKAVKREDPGLVDEYQRVREGKCENPDCEMCGSRVQVPMQVMLDRAYRQGYQQALKNVERKLGGLMFEAAVVDRPGFTDR